MTPQEISAGLAQDLSQVGANLARWVKVAQEWYRQQGIAPTVPGTGKPDEFHVGGTVVLTTVDLSDEQLDALTKEMADGIVKAKAVAYLKGFFTALMLAGGGV